MGAVISPSRVMTARIGWLMAVSNCRSRLVMMPTSVPPSSTMGTPLIEKRSMTRSASWSVLSGLSVIGSRIMPLSDRFTRSTSLACRSIGMFLWMMPMPPSRAMAMAMRDSVTVSMAAASSGMESSMRLVRRVETSVSLG